MADDEQMVELANENISGNTTENSTGVAEIPKTEPEVKFYITKDKMEVSLQIEIVPNCRKLSIDEVMLKIANMGITFGIDREAIERALTYPGTNIICAKGQSPIDGINASIKYHVNSDHKGQPIELADGRVDFKNISMFTIVHVGELLAEKIAATPGTPGMDVMGQTIPAKSGKDVPLPLGKNVLVVDELQVVAALDGQLQIVNNKIHVTQVIEIKEDVDLSTGNIEFIGNVVIRGSVQSGFYVKAEGNVEISGSVSGGIVEGKNVTIKMGIQGMHRGSVKATENVVAKFIENATVNAGNDVMVTDVIMHSKVSAGKKVIVEGRSGLIIGGIVTAGEEIRAQTVGTEMATATELEVGVNPVLREEYQHLRKDFKKLEVSLDQTQKALTVLRAMNQGTMSQDKRDMQLKITKANFQLLGQTEKMRNRMAEIELALEEMRYGRIKVAKIMYPGVKILIGTLIKPIREPMSFVSLYAENGEIKTGTFK